MLWKSIRSSLTASRIRTFDPVPRGVYFGGVSLVGSDADAGAELVELAAVAAFGLRSRRKVFMGERLHPADVSEKPASPAGREPIDHMTGEVVTALEQTPPVKPFQISIASPDGIDAGIDRPLSRSDPLPPRKVLQSLVFSFVVEHCASVSASPCQFHLTADAADLTKRILFVFFRRRRSLLICADRTRSGSPGGSAGEYASIASVHSDRRI